MPYSTFLQIKKLLDDNNITYKHITHEPVGKTSQDAAAVRGTSLDNGVKAIILKIRDKGYVHKDKFFQVAMPGLQRIDLKKLKILLGVKNISLASPDEVLSRTGCTVGSVPPFANLFDMKIYADDSIMQLDEILFSAGTHTDTIMMKSSEYIRIVNPEIVDLKKE